MIDPSSKFIARKTLIALKQAHAIAVSKGWEYFHFNGEKYFTGYAKHLIEYLETKKIVR